MPKPIKSNNEIKNKNLVKDQPQKPILIQHDKPSPSPIVLLLLNFDG